MLSDIFSGLWWVTERCLMGVAVVYALLESVLPDVLFISEEHDSWHNILAGICWAGLYVFLSLKYMRFCKAKLNELNENGFEENGFNVFPFWHWLCYFAAVLMPVAVGYYDLGGAVRFAWIPLIIIPQLNLLYRGEVDMYPAMLLTQIKEVLLVVIAVALFLPMAVIVLIGFLFGFIIAGSLNMARGWQPDPNELGHVCPHCSGSMTVGTTCSCGKSYGGYGYDIPRAADDFPRDAWSSKGSYDD